MPVCTSIASRRPPAVPTNRPPRAVTPPAKLRTVSAGLARWYTHFLVPSAAISACTLPSPANTVTTPSVTRGGATISVETRAVHFGLPLVASNESTSPLSVPTTTMFASAPGPAESARPALVRQTVRPVAGSIRETPPSVLAA